MNGHEIELCRRRCAENHAGAGASGELLMAGDEIGVEMGFDDVLDREAVLLRFPNINIDVAPGIDNRSLAFGTDEVRRMCETTEIELLEVHNQVAAMVAKPTLL